MSHDLPLPSPARPHDEPWYEKAFGAGYLDLYAHRDHADAARAVAFLRERAGLRPGVRLLDLCCGPGRHLSQLAPALGWAVGLDLSRALLARARAACGEALLARADGAPHAAALIEGDMRALPFADASFDVVINLFTSFGYFETEEENESVLREVARALKPGGLFIIDHINRSHLETFLEPDSVRSLAGGAIVEERRSFDPRACRINKRVRWTAPGEGTVEWTESVRVYEVGDLETSLARCGMSPSDLRGDYDGSDFSPASPRMILLCERRSPDGLSA